MTFEEALYTAIQNAPGPFTMHQKRLCFQIERKSSPIHDKIMAVLEHLVRKELGLAATSVVDWSAKTIDWTKIIALLVQILPMILALFGL